MKKKADIEELPNRENNRIKREIPLKWRGYEKFANRVQYSKAARWVHSFKGKTYDELLSEWVKQDWIHPQERNKHTLENWFIAADTVLNSEGVVCTLNEWSGLLEPVKTTSNRPLAIHPETKILFETKKEKKAKYNKYRQVEHLNVFLKPHHQLYNYKGIWFELFFKPVYQQYIFSYDPKALRVSVNKEQPPQEYLNDSMFEKYKNAERFEKFRQLSKKEIKKYKLRENNS